MHVKQNVGESLIGTMLNDPNKTKYRLKACKDLESLWLKLELVPKTVEDGQLFMPGSS